ncbi:MAG: hypothetical protein ABIZ80_03760 [Bryobacteraceae bacterium]
MLRDRTAQRDEVPGDSAGEARQTRGKKRQYFTDEGTSGNVDGGVKVRRAGFFSSNVKLLQEISAGEDLGQVTDLLGKVIEKAVSPIDGRVWMIRGTPRILPGSIAVFVSPTRKESRG